MQRTPTREGFTVTNYQSTVYTVEDIEFESSAAFSTLPPDPGSETKAAGAHDPVLKLWHTTTLPDGQAINVQVSFELDDVRGLQSFLNDQFGRGMERFAVQHPKDKQVARDLSYQDTVDAFGIPGEAEALERLADSAQVASVVGVQFPEGFPGRAPEDRRCPVIYNAVQCSKTEGHSDPHQFDQYWPIQTGDGAATPPAVVEPALPGSAAESATGAGAPDVAPSPAIPNNGYDKTLWAAEERMEQETPTIAEPSDPPKRARRKKEEKAYDDALEAFRRQPGSQLAYTDLTKAAEELRKRFPDANRLEAYDRHVQEQSVSPLLEPQNLTNHRTAEEQAAWAASQKPADAPTPAFAPEPLPSQTHPFVPPATTDHPDGPPPVPALPIPAPETVSAEETAAAQAFPCTHVSETSGRRCIRPAGHELANPPKPHIYAPLEPDQTLPAIPNFIPPMPTDQPGFTATPITGNAPGFTQATIPPFQIPQPAFAPPGTVNDHYLPEGSPEGAAVLSFQVPPTPQVQGAELQPPAPAAPPWGGQ